MLLKCSLDGGFRLDPILDCKVFRFSFGMVWYSVEEEDEEDEEEEVLEEVFTSFPAPSGWYKYIRLLQSIILI